MCKFHFSSLWEAQALSVSSSMANEGSSDVPCASYSDSNTHTSSQYSSEDESDDPSLSVFYFESDPVALKGNRDYQVMIRTLAILESQRTQAIKDLDRLHECEQEALEDPVKFVEKLQCKIDVGLPKPLKVAQLPMVHWERYTNNIDPINFARRKHMTRRKPGTSDNSATASQPGK